MTNPPFTIERETPEGVVTIEVDFAGATVIRVPDPTADAAAQAQITALNTQVTDLTDDLDVMTALRDDAAAVVDARNQTITDLNANITTLTDARDAALITIDARDASIEALDAQIATLNTDLNAAIAARDAAVADLATVTNERDAAVTLAATRTTERDAAQQEADDRAAEITAAMTTLATANYTQASLQQRVEAVIAAVDAGPAVVEIQRVVIMGDSLQADSFGQKDLTSRNEGASAQLTTIAGRNVDVFSAATSGHTITQTGGEVAEVLTAFPTVGETLFIVVTGINDMKGHVPFDATEDATAVMGMRNAYLNNLIPEFGDHLPYVIFSEPTFAPFSGLTPPYPAGDRTVFNNTELGTKGFWNAGMVPILTTENGVNTDYLYADGTSVLQLHDFIRNLGASANGDGIHLSADARTAMREHIIDRSGYIFTGGAKPAEINPVSVDDTTPIGDTVTEFSEDFEDIPNSTRLRGVEGFTQVVPSDGSDGRFGVFGGKLTQDAGSVRSYYRLPNLDRVENYLIEMSGANINNGPFIWVGELVVDELPTSFRFYRNGNGAMRVAKRVNGGSSTIWEYPVSGGGGTITMEVSTGGDFVVKYGGVVQSVSGGNANGAAQNVGVLTADARIYLSTISTVSNTSVVDAIRIAHL